MWQSKFLKIVFGVACLMKTGVSLGASIIEVPATESSPFESLRREIFGKEVDKRTCKRIPISLIGSTEIDRGISQFIQRGVRSLNEQNFKELASMFHGRLSITERKVANNFVEIKNSLIEPIQFTALEFFAINSPTGATQEIQCQRPSDQDIFINPQFGYPLQFSLWIQASGEKELGRLHLGIVPDREGLWRIGLWQQMQWTHDHKDFLEFAKIAESYKNKKRLELAFMNYEASQKLIRNIGFVEFGAFREIEYLKTQAMRPVEFLASIKKMLSEEKMRSVSTHYVEGGLGLVIRVGTEQELSAKFISDYCEAKAKVLENSMSMRGGVAALRCGFIFPNEDETKDGVLGSVLRRISSSSR